MTERWGKFMHPLLKCSKKILYRDIPHALIVWGKAKGSSSNVICCAQVLSFLMDRKQRRDWYLRALPINAWTKEPPRSVSGSHLLNFFINDLAIKNNHLTSIVKYADDTTYPASQSICKNGIDFSHEVVRGFSVGHKIMPCHVILKNAMDWSFLRRQPII